MFYFDLYSINDIISTTSYVIRMINNPDYVPELVAMRGTRHDLYKGLSAYKKYNFMFSLHLLMFATWFNCFSFCWIKTTFQSLRLCRCDAIKLISSYAVELICTSVIFCGTAITTSLLYRRQLNFRELVQLSTRISRIQDFAMTFNKIKIT